MVNGAAYIGGGLAALAVAILVATFTLTAPVVGDAASVNVMPPSVDATESVDLTLVEIFENTEASVVRLTVSRNATGEMDLNRNGVGSGIVFDKMGHIITNAHVVEDSLNTEVTFLDGLV
ncbi:MAG: trypsin, partial [Cenarchaeum sp. SB0664_bin_35]|nr:trypsin [Cenarchaeum sp. SB0664_bin_35]